MTICHTVDEMKTIIYKDEKRRHGIPKISVVFDENETPKLSFPMPIVEYSTYMGGSDGNAQQRSYYSPHRANSRYRFIFLLESAVLNAFKLWQLINPHSKLTHLEFQRQIVEALLAPAGQSRKRSLAIEVKSTEVVETANSCEWEHMGKLLYCGPCKENNARLRKRQALEEISQNYTKRRRGSQTTWRCKSCGPCCKKEICWKALHS